MLVELLLGCNILVCAQIEQHVQKSLAPLMPIHKWVLNNKADELSYCSYRPTPIVFTITKTGKVTQSQDVQVVQQKCETINKAPIAFG